MVKEIRYILTIDGGGMRGLIPAYIIKKMEEKLTSFGDNRPFYSHFDLISGTSTGGLIALALTSDPLSTSFPIDKGEKIHVIKQEERRKHFFLKETISTDLGYIPRLAKPDDILSLYETNGPLIFKPKSDNLGFLNILNKVKNLLDEKYDSYNYEDYISTLFGNGELKNAHTPTMVVAFSSENASPYCFKSWDSHGALIKEAARATSAAPTYFSPYQYLDRETNETFTLLDGGIAANNPILVSYIEARKLYPNADEFRVISLSTCSSPHTMHPEDFLTNIEWAMPLIRAYGDGNMSVTELTAEAMKEMKVYRVSGNTLRRGVKLDETSDEAIAILKEGAEKLWIENEEKLAPILEELAKEETHSSVVLEKDLLE